MTRRIKNIKSRRIKALGYGPGPANAHRAAAEAQRQLRPNDELEAMLREEVAFERKQKAFFELIRSGTDEAFEKAKAADAEWRAAGQEFDRIAEEILSGQRR